MLSVWTMKACLAVLNLKQGNIKDIYADNTFIVVHDAEFSKLEHPKIGTSFELNDHRATIVGIARVASNGLNGVPTLYTTYNRAIEYLPTTRFTISYILVQPKNIAAIANIKEQVAKLGYIALTKDEFNKSQADYYTYKTGIGTNILMMTVISFIVGLSIQARPFIPLSLKTWRNSVRSKPSVAKNRELVYMILFMATVTALIGYGLGIGLVTLMITIARTNPNYAR
jgi:putative ABC transport system permease protein